MIERKKVAMVISGQLRTYKRNFPVLVQNFLNYHDVDIYLSTWDLNYVGLRNSKPKRMDISIIEEKLNLYPNTIKSVICNYDEALSKTMGIITEYANNNIGGKWDPNDKTYHCNPNRKNPIDYIREVCLAWYCVGEGFKLIDTSKKYDFIVKSRFDLAYLKPFQFKDKDLVITGPMKINRNAYNIRNYIIYGKPGFEKIMVDMYSNMLHTMFKFCNLISESCLEYNLNNNSKHFTVYVDPDLIENTHYSINR